MKPSDVRKWAPSLAPAVPVAGKAPKVPEGKSVLNVHVSKREHEWLRDRAASERMSLTMLLRILIRTEMAKDPE